MALQDIAVANISLSGPGVSRAGFGVPLFITSEKLFSDRVRTYTSLPDADASDALPTTSETYKALQAFFSQTPDPQEVKVGRSLNDRTVITFSENDASGNALATGVTITVDVVTASTSTPVTVTVGVGFNTAALIGAQFRTLIEAALVAADGAGVYTVTDDGSGGVTILENNPTVTAAGFSSDDIGTGVVSIVFEDSSATADSAKPAAELAEIQSVDTGFYFVTSQNKSVDYIMAMATAIEATELLYFVSTGAADDLLVGTNPVTATDVPDRLRDGNFFRTIHLFHADTVNTVDYPEARYVAYRAPSIPGSVTWTNLNIAGMSTSKNPTSGKILSSTELTNLNNKNSNFVEDIGKLPILRTGTSSAGEFIDNLRGRDWLVARLEEDITNLLVTQRSGKIPYTNAGMNIVRSVVRKRLEIGVTNGFLADFEIFIDDVQDVDPADKAARVMRLSFKATLAGAIHFVSITGNLEI